MMSDYSGLIRELLSKDSDRKRNACEPAVAAIRELIAERDEATCVLAQARSEADGQRSRAEKAEAELGHDQRNAAMSQAESVMLLDRIEELEEEATAQCDRRAELAVKCGALQAEVDNWKRAAVVDEVYSQKLYRERDEARDAVKRLIDLLRGVDCDLETSALVDPIVKRIVDAQ
jgi:hypothetical protein